MADTLTTITNGIKNYIPHITTATAERVANEAIAEAAARWPVMDATRYIPLQANIEKYRLPDNWAHIRAVWYVKDSGSDPVRLRATEVPALDRDEDGWREYDAGDPTDYYVWVGEEEAVIGVSPKPDTTYTDGYPYIRVQVLILPPTLTANSPVPYLGPSGRRYLVTLAAEKYAEEINHKEQERISSYRIKHEIAVNKYVNSRSVENKASVRVTTYKPQVT